MRLTGSGKHYKLWANVVYDSKTDTNVDNLIDTIIKRPSSLPPSLSLPLTPQSASFSFQAVVWPCSCVFFTSGLAYYDSLP